MEVVLADLRNVPQASQLISSIDRGGGIQPETQPLLFEARIAHELHRQGIQFDYEHEAKVGETKSIDFRIGGAPEFLIEVVSLRTSEGAKETSYNQGDWFGFQMSSYNLHDKELEKQSEESEIIVAQGKLGEKVHKFPEPQPGRLHIIVADVRSLTAPAPAGTAEIGEVGDYLRLITYGYWGTDRVGGRLVPLRMDIPQADGTRRRIQGVFEDGADRPRSAPLLRKRIHAIHFVCEKSFTPGEIFAFSASCVVPNRRLVKSQESWCALANAYPLARSAAPGQQP